MKSTLKPRDWNELLRGLISGVNVDEFVPTARNSESPPSSDQRLRWLQHGLLGEGVGGTGSGSNRSDSTIGSAIRMKVEEKSRVGKIKEMPSVGGSGCGMRTGIAASDI